MATRPGLGGKRRLRTRGLRLWDQLESGQGGDPGRLLLLAEACRVADRLEQLDQLLRGDVATWAKVRLPTRDGDDELVLVVDGALSEARQQQNTLRLMLAQLATPPKPPAGRAAADPEPEREPSLADKLADRRAARGAADPAGP